MCGRYVLEAPDDLSERFQLRDLTVSFPRTWNAAPTMQMPVIVQAEDEGWEARTMQWGLIPRWAKPGETRTVAPINARAETLDQKPMFRGLLPRRRCLVPANGFYEWKATPSGKQPYYVSLRDQPLFAFAGLYDESPDDGVPSYTIITTRANDALTDLHDRMPAILDPDREAAWLDPDLTDPEALKALLVPYPAEQVRFVPVSRRVNNVRNDGPDLVEPIELQQDLPG